jgi:undecaprenyl pyrophosphate phosphatase UppP
VSLTYPEAVVVGALQGVSELFPVSSLGHAVLVPALVGGPWAADLDVSAPESPYLAFIVGLHVATALALLVFYRRDWVRIVGGLLGSLRTRRADTPDARLVAVGVLKLPDLVGPLGNGVRGPVLAGSAAAFVAALVAVRWLTRWFETRTLMPFAIYCLVAGGVSLAVLTLR